MHPVPRYGPTVVTVESGETMLTTAACTLPSEERPGRLAEFDSLFATAVDRVERRADTVRLHLSRSEGVVERVEEVTAREAACCSFFTFRLHLDVGGAVSLDISAPPAYRSILDALAARAERMAS